jgi:hypothetical protein
LEILIAVVVALATLGAVGYLTRRFRPTRTEPRLAVIDAASVDGLRRLVLVRRDDAEHLLLIGGPTDVVIEPNIGRTGAAATAPAPVREPRASPPPREPIAREPLNREAVMAREPKTREPPTREATTRDATLRPPPPLERERLETLIEEAGAPPLPDAGPALRASFELAARAPPAPEPKRVPAPRLQQRAAQDDESILAEMALRLQTALRGPIEPVEPTQSPPAPLPTPPAHPTPLREAAAPPATSASPRRT